MRVTQVTTESTAECEQFRLKYCCYKNLAEVYNAQTSYRMALEMFLQVRKKEILDFHLLRNTVYGA